MSALIDCDYIVYKACAACEMDVDWGNDVILVQSRFTEAYAMVERELFKVANNLGCFDDSILVNGCHQEILGLVRFLVRLL